MKGFNAERTDGFGHVDRSGALLQKIIRRPDMRADLAARIVDDEDGARLIVDPVVENAKPVLFEEIVIDIAYLRDIGDIEARAVGVERRTPHASLGKDFAEPSERQRQLRLGAGPLISEIGWRRAG